MGAPSNRSAREWANPENWLPAMGWEPTKTKPCSRARPKQAEQTPRFTPAVSMTTVPASGVLRSPAPFRRSHSTHAAG